MFEARSGAVAFRTEDGVHVLPLHSAGGRPMSYTCEREGGAWRLFCAAPGEPPKPIFSGDRRTVERALKALERAGRPSHPGRLILASSLLSAILAAGGVLVAMKEVPRISPPRAAERVSAPATAQAPAPMPSPAALPASAVPALPRAFQAAASAPREERGLDELVQLLGARDPILAQGVMDVLQRIASFVSAGRPVPEELLVLLPREVLNRMTQEIVASGRPLPQVAPAGSTPREQLVSGPPIPRPPAFDPSVPPQPAPEAPPSADRAESAPRPRPGGVTFAGPEVSGARDANGIGDLPPRDSRFWSGDPTVRLRIQGGNLERPEDAAAFGIPLE